MKKVSVFGVLTVLFIAVICMVDCSNELRLGNGEVKLLKTNYKDGQVQFSTVNELLNDLTIDEKDKKEIIEIVNGISRGSNVDTNNLSKNVRVLSFENKEDIFNDESISDDIKDLIKDKVS